MIKYRTSNGTIAEFEILTETSTHVAFKRLGNRELKRSERVNWHDTWEKAHEFLVEKANKDVRDANANLRSANRRLIRLCGLKNPNNAIEQQEQ